MRLVGVTTCMPSPALQCSFIGECRSWPQSLGVCLNTAARGVSVEGRQPPLQQQVVWLWLIPDILFLNSSLSSPQPLSCSQLLNLSPAMTVTLGVPDFSPASAEWRDQIMKMLRRHCKDAQGTGEWHWQRR